MFGVRNNANSQFLGDFRYETSQKLPSRRNPQFWKFSKIHQIENSFFVVIQIGELSYFFFTFEKNNNPHIPNIHALNSDTQSLFLSKLILNSQCVGLGIKGLEVQRLEDLWNRTKVILKVAVLLRI